MHQIRFCRHAAVCNRTHNAHLQKRGDQRSGLPDTCPAELESIIHGNMCFGGVNPELTQRNTPVVTERFRSRLQVFAADFVGNFGKGTVTGFGKRRLHLKVAVLAHTIHIAIRGMVGTVTKEGFAFNTGDIVNRRCCGYHLKGGTGRVQAHGHAVDIDTVIILIAFHIVGHIFGVIGRRGNTYKHLAGFIVIYTHGAFSAAERFIRRLAGIGFEG